MASVITYDNVDLNKDSLQFTKPEKRQNIYYSSISYNNKPLFIQTNKLKLISDTNKLNNKEPSLLFEVLSNNFDFYDFFINLDNKLIKDTYNNGKSWFQKEIPLEVIDEMYKRIAKPVQKNKQPTVRFKLPIIQNKIASKIFNQSKEFININNINSNTDCILIIHIRGIKFMKQQYICDSYITQIKAFIPKPNKYLIDDECLITDNFANESDEDILDDEVILNLEKEKNKLNEFKNNKLSEIKLLQEKIDKLHEELKELENK